MKYFDILETNYQEIITTSVLNKMLHLVGMIWIIENNEDSKYDMKIQNSYWMKGDPWYNTSICKKLHGKLFEAFVINARSDRYNIMCYIDVFEDKLNILDMMVAAAVGVVHYQQIQQQKYYNRSVQP